MSGREKKKILRPGSVRGLQSAALMASPQRKSGTARKRTAPSSPMHPPDAASSHGDDVPPPTHTADDFASAPMEPKTLHYRPGDTYPPPVDVVHEQPRSSDPLPAAKGVSFSEVNQIHPPPDEADDDSQWSDLRMDTSTPADSPLIPSKDPESTPLQEYDRIMEEVFTDKDEAPMYEELRQYSEKVTWRYDDDKRFYWAVYDKLRVADMRNILSLRGLTRSGNKHSLSRRLEAYDRRRLTYLRTLGLPRCAASISSP